MSNSMEGAMQGPPKDPEMQDRENRRLQEMIRKADEARREKIAENPAFLPPEHLPSSPTEQPKGPEMKKTTLSDIFSDAGVARARGEAAALARLDKLGENDK